MENWESWENYNKELNTIKSVIEYSKTIEYKAQKLLSEIFQTKLIKEADYKTRLIYDFSVENGDFLLYCKIKDEKLSLQRFWKNNVIDIAGEINREMDLNPKKKMKYLLILIDSQDSTEKMNLEPIYPNILVINLKMLFEINHYIKQDKIYTILFQKLFELSSGVFYDSFIKDFYNLMNGFRDMNFSSECQKFHFNETIIDLNFQQLIEEFTNNMEIIDNKKINSIIQYEEESNKEPTEEDFLRILKISEREIKYYLKLKHQEDSKRREKERELEKKAQIILKEIHNPALNILVNEFNFETQNAKELGDYMLKKGIIKRFPDHISTILLIIPPIGAFISFYHKYVIDQLNENRFRFVYLDDPSHIRKMKKIIEFSEIIIIDITLFLPKIYFILGLLEIYNEKTIIIRQDSYIPAFLSKYKTFTYDLDNYDVIKYDLVKLIKNLTSD